MKRLKNYLKIMAMRNSKAGMMLDMADTNVADVKAMLSAYKFWPNDPLNELLMQS